MDSHSVFPFSRLPAELRLKIYKYAWTVPEEKYIYRSKTFGNMNDGDSPCDEYDIDSDYDEYDSDGYYAGERDNDNALRLSVAYVRAQLSAISKLGAISQRIRAVVYPEYFARCTFSGVRTCSRPKRDTSTCTGPLVLNAVLLIQPAYSRTRKSCSTSNGLLTVSRFKNLRSLDVHVDDATDIGPLTDIHWNYYVNQLDHANVDSPAYDSKEAIRRMFYGEERRAKLMEGLLRRIVGSWRRWSCGRMLAALELLS
ncbi:unnamed protein product [Sordaria macrospora k-hell]|uniref:WGS project CABT00000000 data, contig 2.5 n=1 Tax=Sordaria macrospora (strain ATCC MYA-333 / DSM 997 / K(L3346) / K-hell) TaxID=771870 RepID=F7VRV9_SORMK|nr:uncharacterized protein SMAC_01793 [Sordaria macrospora k-hell]CCC08245.1 unnamed protein product [Sordaria macrospora k-hell]